MRECSPQASRATHEALNDYLKVAAWAGSEGDDEALANLIPDARRRAVLLAGIARLAPRERGQIDEVELSGRLMSAVGHVGHVVTLSRPSHERINRAIDHATAEKVETHVGDLREIDLDEFCFSLRNVDGADRDRSPVRCYFPEEMLEAAKDALDKRIRVTGSRPVKEGRKAPPLMVSRLEILDER